MCLLVGGFPADGLDQLWHRQSCLALLFVVDAQVEAHARQSRLKLLGFGQGPRRLHKFPLCVIDQPQACISFRHIGAKVNDSQILPCREVEVSRILGLVSCGEMLRRFSVSILGPSRGLAKQEREGAESGMPDDQKPMAATTRMDLPGDDARKE